MKKLIFMSLILSFNLLAKDRNITIVNHEYEGTKQWLPGSITVELGDKVNLKLINNVPSGIHGFEIPDFKIKEAVDKGKPKDVSFVADRLGIFDIKCHLHATHVGGQLIVVPAQAQAVEVKKK